LEAQLVVQPEQPGPQRRGPLLVLLRLLEQPGLLVVRLAWALERREQPRGLVLRARQAQSPAWVLWVVPSRPQRSVLDLWAPGLQRRHPPPEWGAPWRVP
jgi:hypothetical protein